MINKLFLVPALAAGISLAACGGGGGSHNSSSNDEPQYDSGYRINSVDVAYQFSALPDTERLEAATKHLSAKIAEKQKINRSLIELTGIDEYYDELYAVLKKSAAVFVVSMSPSVDIFTNGSATDASYEENILVSITLNGMELPYFQFGPVVVIGLSVENLNSLQKLGIDADICLYDENGDPHYDLSGKAACASKKLDIPVNSDSFAKISTGDDRTCGLTRGGDVYCWGQNFMYEEDKPDLGVLGLSSDYQEMNYPIPMKLAMPDGKRIIDISTGVTDTYAISSLYDLVAWGDYVIPSQSNVSVEWSNVPVIIGTATTADAGFDYPAVYYVTPGSEGNSQYCSRYSGCLEMDGELVTQVSAGDLYRCNVDAESRLTCYGRLGSAIDQEQRIGDMGLENVSKVSVGDYFACAISNLNLYCWGNNVPKVKEYFSNKQYYEDKIGLVGTGNSTDEYIKNPSLVSSLSEVSDVSVGSVHACAISKGEVYCWGAAENCSTDSYQELRLGVSQIGLGADTKWTSTPTKVKGLKNIVSVDAGRFRTCAMDRDGKAWCFGANIHGELGNGQINDGGSTTPVEVLMN